jgi:hypothetical protein
MWGIQCLLSDNSKVSQEVVCKAEGREFVSFADYSCTSSRSTPYHSPGTVILTSGSRDWRAYRHFKCREAGPLSSPQLPQLQYGCCICCHHHFNWRFNRNYRLKWPITRSFLQIDLSIVPDFRWDEKVHGTLEDVDGEIILFRDSFVLRQRS